MFQSLIGRLKTVKVGKLLAIEPEFQSLIGRLKTSLRAGCLPRGRSVSIPHR